VSEKPTYAQLVRLVEKLIDAIASELQSAGPEEVQQHPTLRGKQQLVSRAETTLARAKGKQP